MVRHLLATSLGFATAFFFAVGCTSQEQKEEAVPPTHFFGLKVDQTTVRVQVVITPREMARGLMDRTQLEPDEGMLFAYSRPRQASFWMKNTPLPLDIGFFSPDGRLLEVYRMFPYDETKVVSKSDQVQFALEMNQGWFSRNGLRPGAVLDLDLLREALKARGTDPAQ